MPSSKQRARSSSACERVMPWLLWMLMAHAHLSGTCERERGRGGGRERRDAGRRRQMQADAGRHRLETDLRACGNHLAALLDLPVLLADGPLDLARLAALAHIELDDWEELDAGDDGVVLLLGDAAKGAKGAGSKGSKGSEGSREQRELGEQQREKQWGQGVQKGCDATRVESWPPTCRSRSFSWNPMHGSRPRGPARSPPRCRASR